MERTVALVCQPGILYSEISKVFHRIYSIREDVRLNYKFDYKTALRKSGGGFFGSSSKPADLVKLITEIPDPSFLAYLDNHSFPFILVYVTANPYLRLRMNPSRELNDQLEQEKHTLYSYRADVVLDLDKIFSPTDELNFLQIESTLERLCAQAGIHSSKAKKDRQ